MEIERIDPAQASALAERYAGFVGAEGLTRQEQVEAVASLVPMALHVVDEARDTIERLNAENEALIALLEKIGAHRWVIDAVRGVATAENTIRLTASPHDQQATASASGGQVGSVPF